MSIIPRSDDCAKSENPADRELGSVNPSQKRCIACGDPAFNGELCLDCYKMGRTCGPNGEMEES